MATPQVHDSLSIVNDCDVADSRLSTGCCCDDYGPNIQSNLLKIQEFALFLLVRRRGYRIGWSCYAAYSGSCQEPDGMPSGHLHGKFYLRERRHQLILYVIDGRLQYSVRP